jgi:MFS family permease
VFWAVIAPFLIPPIFSTAFFFNMVHLTEIKNWSLISFTALFPFYTSMSILTTLSSGWILDKFGVEKILPFYLLPMSLGLLIFSYGDTYVHAMIGLAFLGMTQGLAMTIGGTFWPTYYGTKNLGSVRSLSTSTMVFGTSLGPALVGILLDFGHNYNFILLGMCILAIFASVSLAITMTRAPKLLSENIKKGA